MAYEVAREIRNRVADGDDIFIIEDLGDGRVRLVPAPNSVTDPGTSIDRDLLQPMEDKIAKLMNYVFDNITTNLFSFDFSSLDGLSVIGVWNESLKRIEC